MCSVGTRGGGKKEGGKVGRGWSRKGRRDGAYYRRWRGREKKEKEQGIKGERRREGLKLWEGKCAENSFVPLPSFQLAPAAPSVLSSYTPSPLLLELKFTPSLFYMFLSDLSSLLRLWALWSFSLTFSFITQDDAGPGGDVSVTAAEATRSMRFLVKKACLLSPPAGGKWYSINLDHRGLVRHK